MRFGFMAALLATLVGGAPLMAADTPPSISSVVASPATVSAKTSKLTATANDDGGPAALAYTWSATGPAAVGFSATGTNAAKATTATFTAPGSYQCTVSVADALNQTRTASVTVTVSSTLSALAISPTIAVVNPTTTKAFTATAKDQFGTVLSSQPFSWTVSGATLSTIDGTGLLTAGQPGAATAAVTLGGKAASATVRVNAAPTVANAVTTGTSTISGATAEFSVQGSDDDNLDYLLYTWSAVGPLGGTVNKAVSFAPRSSVKGEQTMATFTAIGTYTITATITDRQGLTAVSSTQVTVVPTPTTLSTSPATGTILNPGSTKSFTASVRDQFRAVMAPQPALAWVVSAGGGTIDATGLYTAAAPIGPATVTATASSPAGSATGSATLRVNAAPTIANAVTTGTSTITGTTAEFSVLGADDDNVDYLLYTWSATGPKGVAFAPRSSVNGEQTIATFGAVGEYDITATVKDRQGLTAVSTTHVQVLPTPTTLTVSPASGAILNPGATKAFTATVHDQFKAAIVSAPALAWAVTAGGGSIDATGLYTAAAPTGPATLTATATGPAGSATGSATLRVNAAPTVTTEASTDTPSITGTTGNFTVQGGDDDNVDYLIYTWSATGPLGGTANKAVSFTPRNSNLGEHTTATFSAVGEYTITVVIKDRQGLTTSSQTSISVLPTTTGITISPTPTVVNPTSVRSFTAAVRDQFNALLATQPAVQWEAAGGTITTAGKYTSGSTSGSASATVRVTVRPTLSATAAIRINAQPQVALAAAADTASPAVASPINLSVLGKDDLDESTLTYSWSVISGGATGVVFSGATQGTNVAKALTVTVARAGIYVFKATIKDAQGLTTASSVTVTFGKTTPVITWDVPAPITYGTALSLTQLNATTTTVPGAFVYAPAAGTVPPAGTQTLTVSFVPTDTAGFTTATASVSLVVNKAVPTLTWAPPADLTAGTALSSLQLDAVASVDGTFVYSPAIGTLLDAGTYTLHVDFTPLDGEDYAAVSGEVILHVLDDAQLHVAILSPQAGAVLSGPGIPVEVRVSGGDPTAVQSIRLNDIVIADHPQLPFQQVVTLALPNGEQTISAAAFVAAAPPVVAETPVNIQAPGGDLPSVALQTSYRLLGNDANALTFRVVVDRPIDQDITVPVSLTGALRDSGSSFLYDARSGEFGTDLTLTIPASSGESPFAECVVYLDAYGEGLPASGITGRLELGFPTGASLGAPATTDLIVQPNHPPLITRVTVDPAVIDTTTCQLTASATDDGGPDHLTYGWVVLHGPAGVSFSDNFSHTASSVTATFYATGHYEIRCEVNDGRWFGDGLGMTTVVPLDVLPRARVILDHAVVNPGGVINARLGDQFGVPWSTAATWEADGGTISPDGLFTAGGASGAGAIRAQVDGAAPSAAVRINAAPQIVSLVAEPATVTASSTVLQLVTSDDDDPATVLAVWSLPSSATHVMLSANGQPAGPITATFGLAGVYPFTVVVTDPQGLSATANVTVTVQQVPTEIVLTPSPAVVQAGATESFTAEVHDQFGTVITDPAVVWTASGGTIAGIGTSAAFTADGASGQYGVTATVGAVLTRTAPVRVNTAPVISAITLDTDPVHGRGCMAVATISDDLPADGTRLAWTVLSGPAGGQAQSQPDGRSALLSFSGIGTYRIQVVATDGDGASAMLQRDVIVLPASTTVVITTTPVPGDPPGRIQFHADVRDQFGDPASHVNLVWTLTGPGSFDPLTGIYTPSGDGGAAVVGLSVDGSSLVATAPVPGTSGPGTGGGTGGGTTGGGTGGDPGTNQPPAPTGAVIAVASGLTGVQHGLIDGEPADFSKSSSLTVRVVANASAPLLRVDLLGAGGTASSGDPGLFTLTDLPEGTYHLGAQVTVGNDAANTTATFSDLLTVVVDRTPPSVLKTEIAGKELTADQLLHLNANTEARCAFYRNQGLFCYPADSHKEDITVQDGGSGLIAKEPTVWVQQGTPPGTQVEGVRWAADAALTEPTTKRVVQANSWGAIPDTVTYSGFSLSPVNGTFAAAVVMLEDQAGNTVSAMAHVISIKQALPQGRMAALPYQQPYPLEDLGDLLSADDTNTYDWYSPTALLQTSLDVWKVDGSGAVAGLASGTAWVVPATANPLTAVDGHGNEVKWDIAAATSLDLSDLPEAPAPSTSQVVHFAISGHDGSESHQAGSDSVSTFDANGEWARLGDMTKLERNPVPVLAGLPHQPLDGLFAQGQSLTANDYQASASDRSGLQPFGIGIGTGALLSGEKDRVTGLPRIYDWTPGSGFDTGWMFPGDYHSYEVHGPNGNVDLGTFNSDLSGVGRGWVAWWSVGMIGGSQDQVSTANGTTSSSHTSYSYDEKSGLVHVDVTSNPGNGHQAWDQDVTSYLWLGHCLRRDETKAPETWPGHATWVVGNPGAQSPQAQVILPLVLKQDRTTTEVIWKHANQDDATQADIRATGFSEPIPLTITSRNTDEHYAMLRGTLPGGWLRMTAARERSFTYRLDRSEGSTLGPIGYNFVSANNNGADTWSGTFTWGGAPVDAIHKDLTVDAGIEKDVTGFGLVHAMGVEQATLLAGGAGQLTVDGPLNDGLQVSDIVAITDIDGNNVLGSGDTKIEVKSVIPRNLWEDPLLLMKPQTVVELLVGSKVEPKLYHIDFNLGKLSNDQQMADLGLKISEGVYRVKEVMNVVRVEFVDMEGKLISHDNPIRSINAKTVNESTVQQSGGGAAERIPEFGKYRYGFDVALSAPLQTTVRDVFNGTIKDSFTGESFTGSFTESGLDTGVFIVDSPLGLEPQFGNVISLYDSAQNGEFHSIYHLTAAFSGSSSESVSDIRSINFGHYRSPENNLEIQFSENDPTAVLVSGVVDSVTISSEELTDQGDGAYMNQDGRIQMFIERITGHGYSAPNSVEIRLISDFTSGRSAGLDLLESGIGTGVYASAVPSPGSEGQSGGVPTIDKVRNEYAYKARVTDTTHSHDIYEVPLAARVAGGDHGLKWKFIGQVKAIYIGNGVYESKPIISIGSIEELSAESKGALADREMVSGSGSSAFLVVSGVIVGTAVAYEVTTEVGGLATDLGAWGFRGAMWAVSDSPNANQKWVYVHDGGNSIFGLTGLGVSTWREGLGVLEKPQYGYTLSVHTKATYSSMLQWLNDLTVDDVFVYFGHGYTGKPLITLPDGTRQVQQDCVGLMGHRYGLLHTDIIPVSKISYYMNWKGKGHAPGIAVLGGCGSFLDPMKKAFLDNGTLLYVGITQPATSGSADIMVRKFMQAFFNEGASVNDALDQANEDTGWNTVNKETTVSGERVYMWAATSDGQVYNYDKYALDPNDAGNKGISRTFADFKRLMDAKELEYFSGN